ncbi:MAG: pyruvate formate lyase-activating protein [Balneolia bacterium]|nr:pyruvate formate lyase-activating protein [Balneolia bacterium]
MKDVTGYIHSVETAGTLDGPGVRRVLFLQGCPLKCLYCHNPDSREFKCGRQTTSYEQLREIAKSRGFLMKSGGGVTLSGGEPLSQPEFVKSIFEGCKMMGLHTALDTSGFTGWRADDELLSFTDLVLLDIKHIEPDGYKKLTGVDLQPTLDFARRLADMGKPVWLRYVLVPGYTDNQANIKKLAELAKELGNVERVDILPFHNMGSYKWKELGMDYKLENTPEPEESSISMAQSAFREAGLTVY